MNPDRDGGGRPLLKLVLNRLGLGLLTLFAASVLIFIGTEILPGDLASAILQNTATPEALAKMRLDLGLNQPAYVRFFEWLFGALHGDFGKSLANGRDVLTEIAPRFANTMFLAAYAAVVAVPLAIGLGLLAAIRQGGVFDRLVNVVTLMTISVPEYFLAYILIKYVAVELGWFPSLASVSSDTPFFDRLYVAFLPMLTLVLVIIAHMMRMTRASVLSVMASPISRWRSSRGSPNRGSWCATRCRTRSRRSSRWSRSTSPISSSASSWSRPSSSIPASAN